MARARKKAKTWLDEGAEPDDYLIFHDGGYYVVDYVRSSGDVGNEVAEVRIADYAGPEEAMRLALSAAHDHAKRKGVQSASVFRVGHDNKLLQIAHVGQSHGREPHIPGRQGNPRTRRRPNQSDFVWTIVAEHTPGENRKGCETDGEYVDVIESFDDQVEAERFAQEVRDSGEYGDFGNKQEWSDCGWWISVRKTKHRKTAAKPPPPPRQTWGIPRARNAGPGGDEDDDDDREGDLRYANPEVHQVQVEPQFVAIYGHALAEVGYPKPGAPHGWQQLGVPETLSIGAIYPVRSWHSVGTRDRRRYPVIYLPGHGEAYVIGDYALAKESDLGVMRKKRPDLWKEITYPSRSEKLSNPTRVSNPKAMARRLKAAY